MVEVKDQEGVVQSSRELIMQIAKEFYKNLYSSKGKGVPSKLREKESKEEVPEIIEFEVDSVLKKL